LPSYAHKQIIKCIKQLDEVPIEPDKFSEWIKAVKHLKLLQDNAHSDEVIIYASGDYTYVHTIVVPNSDLKNLKEGRLFNLNSNPYTSAASYVYGGGRNDVWIERKIDSFDSEILKNASNLVFGRTFEGCNDEGRSYYELNQEYSHIAGIHWRVEHGAYIRFDDNGDIEHTVSISKLENDGKPISLVSFKWEPLEKYLAAADSSLVRMFDFTLLRRESFSGWPSGDEQTFSGKSIFYRQKVMEKQAAYTHGAQIISIRQKKEDIFKEMKGETFGKNSKKYADFIIHDWRNKRTTKVSAKPTDTTNYFEAQSNSLPFELSPAFFRPEVLSKYKTDRDKYTVGERDIQCRASWRLQAYDINEAGQVFAYICYLRSLPYSEQQHWASFNEEPKAGISERAITNDFQGEFTTFISPLQQVLGSIRIWNNNNVYWWKLEEYSLLNNVSVPITSSRDEWSEAFMDLSKLIIEGFETKKIRKKLDEANLAYDKQEGSIVLLEKLITKDLGEEAKLPGLRTVQKIRSKVKGHSRNSEAKLIEKEVLTRHETFKSHFEYICGLVAEELSIIEGIFNGTDKDR
jgi:hypothetical protein